MLFSVPVALHSYYVVDLRRGFDRDGRSISGEDVNGLELV